MQLDKDLLKSIGNILVWMGIASIAFCLIALLLSLTGCGICPPCPPTVTPAPTVAPTATPVPIAVQYDPRVFDFDGHSLNVKVYPCASCRYKARQVFITVDGVFDGAPQWAWQYINMAGAGGATHTFAVVRKVDGSPLVGKNVILSWPDGSQGGTTWDDGSVNFYTNGMYYPDRGETGPYCMQPLNGDQVCGGGLPWKRHVSLWVVYDEVNVLQSTDESMGVRR